MSNTDPMAEDIDQLVRDLTKVTPMPKSEVKARLTTLLKSANLVDELNGAKIRCKGCGKRNVPDWGGGLCITCRRSFICRRDKRLKDFSASTRCKAYEKVDLPFEVSKLVTDMRLESGLTQTELAKKAGTKQESIARLESGNMLPSLSFLQKVARAMGYEVEVKIKGLQR